MSKTGRVASTTATPWRGTVFDQAAYWLTVLAVYFLVGVLVFYSGKGKPFDGDGKAPPLLREQFEGTFTRPKALLLVALALALVSFACLSFGQTSTGNNEGTASLYTYFASTAIIFLLVLRLPPNGPADWLSARRRAGE